MALEIRSSTAISEVFGKIVIGNLVRNSLAYSQAIVDIHLSGNRLVIRNDLSANQIRGYGYGKEIVSAVCQAAGWCYYSNVNDKQRQTFYFSRLFLIRVQRHREVMKPLAKRLSFSFNRV